MNLKTYHSDFRVKDDGYHISGRIAIDCKFDDVEDCINFLQHLESFQERYFGVLQNKMKAREDVNEC